MSEQETVPADNDGKSENELLEVAGETADQNLTARTHQGPLPAGDATRGERLVPVSEAKKYRKRAQAAEKILADLKAELGERDRKLQEQQRVISDLQRREQISELLQEAGAVDLETATLLTEMALAETDEPDVDQTVSDLRRRKPFLFRSNARGAAVLGPKIDNDRSPAADVLERAAVEAHTTGSRSALLRYLRLRRHT